MSERRVLIVDDDFDILDVLSLVLTAYGYVVRTAIDGRAALRVLDEGFEPSLILLDLMMPGMDGWEFREKQLDDPKLAGIRSWFARATPWRCADCHHAASSKSGQSRSICRR